MSRSGRLPASESGTYAALLRAPFAALGIRTEEDWLVGIDYLPPDTAQIKPRSALAREVWRQLEGYVEDPRFVFDLPLHLPGTPFQRRVWQAIATIPSGATESYGAVARRLHTGPRPVGAACGANPIPLLIPCHRVVAADGSLGGFMHTRWGGPLAIKRWLLDHERS